MRVLSFNEPYISFNVQNLIYASNAFDLDEQIENILKDFPDEEKSYLKHTAILTIMELTLIDKKKRINMSTQDVYKKLFKKRHKFLLKNYNEDKCKEIFLAQTYLFVKYCKNDPDDVFNVFGLRT